MPAEFTPADPSSAQLTSAELTAVAPAPRVPSVPPGQPTPEPGALSRAVEIMDRLRSPGGCPWDAEQTHESLAPYLLEETYEALEAIETGDAVLLREELGDLLLQVLFHARLATELPPQEAFDIDDVAGDLVAKLIRRHPHVFAGDSARDAAEVNENWERLKAHEKRRSSVTDGVPLAQPSLALAAKLIARTTRAGLVVALPQGDADDAAAPTFDVTPTPDARGRPATPGPSAEFGARLFAVVQDAVAAGVDPEQALRRTTYAYRDAIRAAEQS